MKVSIEIHRRFVLIGRAKLTNYVNFVRNLTTVPARPSSDPDQDTTDTAPLFARVPSSSLTSELLGNLINAWTS